MVNEFRRIILIGEMMKEIFDEVEKSGSQGELEILLTCCFQEVLFTLVVFAQPTSFPVGQRAVLSVIHRCTMSATIRIHYS